MKRFSFNLEKILQLRRYEERRWELKLGEATSRCTSISHRIKECSRQRDKVFAGRRFTGVSGFSDFRVADTYMKRLEEKKVHLSEELAVCQKERETLKKKYLEASRKRKVIEKLRERKEQQYYREQRRAEQKELDEIAAGRIRR